MSSTHLRHDQLRTRGPQGKSTRAAVLVLHGGTDDVEKAKRPRRPFLPATMNSHWIQNGVHKALGTSGVATWALSHRLAGWDDNADPTPVREARAAIERIRLMHSDTIPLVLIGISMGARTAVRVADEPNVRGVVGLVPWLPPDEPVENLRGKHLRVGHASLDTVAPWKSMENFVERASRVASSVHHENLGPDVHEMVLPRTWQPFAARCVEEILARG